MGAYLRPPEPASVYRMHAACNGCYAVQQHRGRQRRWSSPTRRRSASTAAMADRSSISRSSASWTSRRAGSDIDPAELRRRNFVPKDAFPYHVPGRLDPRRRRLRRGARRAVAARRLRRAEAPARRGAARPAGSIGIGFCAGVEPSGSNMAYVSLAQTAGRARQDRSQVGRAMRARWCRSIPSGSVTVRLSTHAERAGACDGRGADRRRQARPEARRHRRGDRDRHAHQRTGRSRRATIPTASPPSWSRRSRRPPTRSRTRSG